jgi:tetratricopeptide (TPR) repeat protein
MKPICALLLACLFLLPSAAFADAPDGATAAYNAGDLETAARLFAEAADASPHSVAARYNLGNAFFRLGRLPEAMQAYRSAQLLSPRDPDIRRNLFLAATAAGVPLPEPAGVRKAFAVFSARELTTILRIGYLALVAFLLLAYSLPAARRAFLHLAVPAALLALFALAGLWLRARDARTPERILAEEMPARSAPLEDATTLATLPAGTFVRVQETRGGWLCVLAGEVLAWVPADRTLAVPR